MKNAHLIALKRNKFQRWCLIAGGIFFVIALTLLAVDKYRVSGTKNNFSDDSTPVLLKKANDSYSKGDFENALPYLEEASKRGSAKAQYSLGYMYQNGEGVEKNLVLAKEYFQLSAEQGHTKAKNALKKIGE